MSTAQQVVPRAEIARQAVQGNPWTFIQSYWPFLAKGDQPEIADDLRVFLAHNLLRLGLRTPAVELFDSLGPAAKRHPGVTDAIRNAQRLPADAIDPLARVELCRLNLAVIADRSRLPDDLDLRFHSWREGLGQSQAFKTTTGVPVLRRMIDGVWVWTHLADQVAIGNSLQPKQVTPGPLYIDGIHAPLALRKLVELAARTPLGLEPSITLLAATDTEFFDALSLADLRPVLAQDRVRTYVGPDAPRRLESDLLDDLDRSLGLLIALPSPPPTPGRFTQAELTDLLKGVGVRQLEAQEQLASRLAARDASRDEKWWADRYQNPGARPLRVLIPTTRFSSFLKHSAADMADAMRSLGWEAKVVVEPDERGNLSALGYARQIEAFDPDLIILLNATRSLFYGILPPGIPIATWIQDAMPHLFDKKVGAAMGPRDYLVGHLHRELFERFEYPTARMLHTPVVANPGKFSSVPARGSFFDQHRCEVAYASHHAETPAELRDRFLRDAGGGPNAWICPALNLAFEDLCAAGQWTIAQGDIVQEIGRIALQSLRITLGADPSPEQLALFTYSVARPIAERANRHQMIRWASQICARRRWRFHLYGRGWDRSQQFRDHARGELPHGEELRASYQAAAAHLQGGLASFLHQRLVECVLSGGLPLVRASFADLSLLREQVSRRLTIEGMLPEYSSVIHRTSWALGSSHPDTMKLIRIQQLWGVDVTNGAKHHPELLGPAGRFEASLVPERDVIWLLGDHDQTMFDSETRLEALLANAVEQPRWRTSLVQGIRARAARSLTYDVVLGRLVAMIRDGLAVQGASGPELTREKLLEAA